MKFPLLAVPVLCLAVAAACGGSGEPGKSPDEETAGAPTTPPDQPTSGQPTAPPDQGTAGAPTTPPDQGTSGQPTPPPDQGTAGGPTTPPDPGTSGQPTSPPGQPAAKYLVRIDCVPVNDFGYIGSAKGDLHIGARTPDGAFTVNGTLELRYKFIDAPETAKEVQVEGTLDKGGQYVSARVMTGADDLESVYFVLSPNSPYSAINSPNGGPAYQTQCDASTADIPQGSDLRPEGSMRFYDRGDGTIGVRVNVVNIGNQPASGATGRARIGTSTANAELHPFIDGTATAPNAVPPGGRGYIEVVLPQNALARCMQPQVVIDLDHEFQSGAPDPFANDTAEVWTQCVTWSRPISGDSLGFEPDPFLEGKTLGNIVGSSEVGRKDLKLCSQCHYEASGNKYSPPLPSDGSGVIHPTDLIGGTTWAAPGGWASRFLTNPINKPDYLKVILQQWIDDGALP